MNLRLFQRPSEPTPKVRSIEAGRSEAEPNLAQVEATMKRIITAGGLDRLSAMALNQLDSGGRRVRSRLALKASELFGVQASDAVAWAASVELLHNATLVHDDIQDGDTLRRGRPTTWARYGVAQAINVGDFLLMLPYAALSLVSPEFRGDLALVLAETSTRVVRGQVEELSLLPSGRLDSESYYAAARGKTGALFELPVTGAAVLAGMSASEVGRLADIFGQLGLAFQIQDDVIDLFGDKGRGERGADIREGKVSALIVELLLRCPHLSPDILAILQKPRAETTLLDIDFIANACVDYGALDGVLAKLHEILVEVEGASLGCAHPAVRHITRELAELSLAPLAAAGLVLSPAQRGVAQ